MNRVEESGLRPPNAGGARRGVPRPRIHLIYYALALFDILAVSLGLLLLDRIAGMSLALVETNEAWVSRLQAISDLRMRAADVNAPGNDVFATGDIEAQSQRLEVGRARFLERFDDVCRELDENVPAADAHALVTRLRVVLDPMDEMCRRSAEIFRLLADRQRLAAGVDMAAMDRAFNEISAALAVVEAEARGIQQTHIQGQADTIRRMQRFEIVLGCLIVLMVVSVTFYGHMLAVRLKSGALETEEHLRALAESEGRLQGILDNTTSVVYVKDIDGRYVLINHRFEVLFRVERRAVIGRTDFDLFPEKIARAFRDHDEQALEHGAAMEFEETVPYDDGPRTYISVRFPLRDADGLMDAVCGISTDITDRKAAEHELAGHRDQLEELVVERTSELKASQEKLRLSDRLAAIGTLAAGLGHDMNNVLFPVRCQLDALDVGELPEAARSHFRSVRGSVEYLQQLSDGLRLLSLDPDEVEGSLGVTEPAVWWSENEALFHTALPKYVTLQCAFAPELPALPVAAHQLTQAVFNLVVNAGEAMAEPGVVRVWARSDSAARTVTIGVSDTGAGMPDDVSEHALDPFFTTKKRGLSTGLGLALVHGIVTNAGGITEVDSERGAGTTVTMTFPVAEPIAPPGAERERSAVVTLPDPRLASFVAALLESVGFVVHYGDEAAVNGDVLWVTGGEPGMLEAARRFLSQGEKRRVIAFGSDLAEWKRLGAVCVDSAAELGAVRRAIHMVIEGGAG